MRLARVACLSLAGLIAVAACSASPPTQQSPTSSGATSAPTALPASGLSKSCHVSAELVPSCGVLWGIATAPETPRVVAAAEQTVGRRFDIIYRYHDINARIPQPSERKEIRDGHILHIAIAARDYQAPNEVIKYRDITAGRYDAALTAQGEGIASLRVPVFVTFEQEANQHDKLGPRGSATDFKRAWRHIHRVYVEAGATNAVWVWVMTGLSYNLSRAARLWPGNSYVDWISWNVYNQSGCGSGVVDPVFYTSYQRALAPFFNWVHSDGPGLGMDPNKPMMISETGSVIYGSYPARTAGWYGQIPSVLKMYPQIKAVSLWDNKTSDACDFRFQGDADVVAAVSAAGLSPTIVGGPTSR